MKSARRLSRRNLRVMHHQSVLTGHRQQQAGGVVRSERVEERLDEQRCPVYLRNLRLQKAICKVGVARSCRILSERCRPAEIVQGVQSSGQEQLMCIEFVEHHSCEKAAF